MAVLGLSCACGDRSRPSIDLTRIPEAWSVTAIEQPMRGMASDGEPGDATGAPAFHPGERLLFELALPPGSRLEGEVSFRLPAGTRIALSLVGEKALAWVGEWATPAETGRQAFTVVTPDSATFRGGVFSVAGGGETCGTVRVERLSVKSHAMPKRPSVIVLTLDTFRADHLSCISPDAPPTPTLDSLAREGAQFTRAVSTSQATTPSHISIMTGLYCFAHGVYQNSRGVSNQAVTMAELLKSNGYRTMAAVSVAHLNPEVSNLGQGFESFLPSRWPGPEGEPADVRTTEVIRALLRSPMDRRPLFLWIHYFDPHTPYTPPRSLPAPSREAGTGMVLYAQGMGLVRHDTTTGLVLDPYGEISRYRGETAFLDREIGRLLRRLDAMGFMDRAVIAVVGDHGEGLGEHGVFFEHAGMYEPILNVPMIFCGRGVPTGTRVDARVSTVSVLPTLLALADVDDAPPSYGRDLLRLASGTQNAGDDLIFSEAVTRRICAAWEGSRKLIWVPGSKETDWTMPERVLFFDLASDPEESRNLLEGNEEAAKRLRDLWGEQVRDPLVRLDAWEGSPDATRLKALGYVE
jgi:arylsulfatase A-like enzyme